MSVPRDFEEFFALLNREKVKYIIVGAYALAYHGIPRFTGDIDIFIGATKSNVLRLLKVLPKFGFENLSLVAEDFVNSDKVVQLGYPPLRIDLLTSIDGVKFQDAWKKRKTGTFGKEVVNYLSKPDLIRNKRATGGAKDKLDLELLQQ